MSHFLLFLARRQTQDSLQTRRLYSPWNSPGQNPGVGSLSLLQGIFLTQGSNLGLPHCRQLLYHLSQQGSLILEINKMKHVKALALDLV